MKLLLTFGFVVLSSLLFAQDKITTIILVRHAEKEVSTDKDPDLSAAGKQRALKLAEMLSKTQLDAVYSTHFKRTESTVAMVAGEHQLTIANYNGKADELDAILAKHAGQTILICGHSNTTPAFVNELIGKDDYKTFDDSDYGNFIIVTLSEKINPKVTWLRY